MSNSWCVSIMFGEFPCLPVGKQWRCLGNKANVFGLRGVSAALEVDIFKERGMGGKLFGALLGILAACSAQAGDQVRVEFGNGAPGKPAAKISKAILRVPEHTIRGAPIRAKGLTKVFTEALRAKSITGAWRGKALLRMRRQGRNGEGNSQGLAFFVLRAKPRRGAAEHGAPGAAAGRK